MTWHSDMYITSEGVAWGSPELNSALGTMESVGPSTDMKAFREIFSKARNIVVLSGAGMSAESGVPTFR